MLRQIEWGSQNGPITKNRILPVTTLYFLEFCFSLRTSYKELIWCTNYLNANIHTFVSAGVLFDGVFSLSVSLKQKISTRIQNQKKFKKTICHVKVL